MIWCVEDDASIRDIELYALRSAGLEAEGFTDGAAFWKALQSEKPDLVVLDVMLPGIDGTELLGRMRASTSLRRIPVIMATAKGAEYDRVRALDGGADDYLTKPFSVIELVSRVKAVLRRCQTTSAAAESTEGVIEFDNLRLDMNSYELRVKGKVVEAPPKELELLFHLASHPNRVFTRDQLLDEVWGFEYYGDSRTVDVHIKRLREKLEGVSDQWSLKTVWGVGYKFEVKE